MGAAADSVVARRLRNTVGDRAVVCLSNIPYEDYYDYLSIGCCLCMDPPRSTVQAYTPLYFCSNSSRQTHHHHGACHPLTSIKTDQDAHLNPQGSHQLHGLVPPSKLGINHPSATPSSSIVSRAHAPPPSTFLRFVNWLEVCILYNIDTTIALMYLATPHRLTSRQNLSWCHSPITTV